jgi:GGDEF domain-containing protein
LYLGRPAQAYSRPEVQAERRWVRQVHGAVRNAAAYRKAVEEQTRDIETGVFNGLYMDLRIEEEYRRSERFGRDLSLVSIRTESNIRGVAAWLVDKALDTDLVAHLGNGHFAVLLIEAPGERVEHFVNQVRGHDGLEVKDVVSYDRSQR